MTDTPETPDTPRTPKDEAAPPSDPHRPDTTGTDRTGTGGPEAKPGTGIWMRGLQMLLVAMLIGLAQTVLQVVTLIQFVLMLIDNGRPNAQIAAFGKGLGDWFAKAARFQTGQSEVKPWPWTPLE